MLSKDIQITDIAPDHFGNLGSLLSSGQNKKPDGMILFYDGGHVIHAVHTRTGPCEITSFEGPRHLASVAKAEKVDYVVALEQGAIRRMAVGAQSRIRWDDPLSLQALALLNAVTRENGQTMHIYPPRKKGRLKPDAWMIQWLRRLTPRDKLYALIVFDDAGEDIWFSAIVRVRDGECNLLTTVDSLRLPPLAGLTPAQKNRAVLDRVRETHGPVAGALFMDRAMFAYCVRSDRPITAVRRALRRGWAKSGPMSPLMRLILVAAGWMGW